MSAADINATHEAYEDTVGWLEVKFNFDAKTLRPFDLAQIVLLARIARAVEDNTLGKV